MSPDQPHLPVARFSCAPYFSRALLFGGAVIVWTGSGATAQPVQWPVAEGGNGNYFEVVVHSADISWNDARTAAEARSFMGHAGILASAATQPKDFFLRELAAATPGAFQLESPGGFSGPWIGGFQLPGSMEPAEGFTWINGDTWNYTNWFNGEPNDGAGDVPSEEAVQLFTQTAPVQPANIRWNDLFAGDGPFFPVNSYVVEYVIPGPSAVLVLGFGGVIALGRRQR